MTTDPFDTKWPAKPHTLAKHSILARYLQAWLPILSRATVSEQRDVLFVDGFAGPGEYERGEPGSPIIALRAALNHELNFRRPVHFLFIEQREDRFQNLSEIINDYRPSVTRSPRAVIQDVRQGDCDEVLRDVIRSHQMTGRSFGPALVFLDQFGYGAVSMDLISTIMKWPNCEVFSYLDARGMNRWISDETKHPSFELAFGDSRWRKALSQPEKDRRGHLLTLYMDALRTNGHVEHVQNFAMFDQRGELLYWLFFCTNNIRGLEEMKKAMWYVDQTGTFRFSDRDDRSQIRLLSDAYSQEWLSDHLSNTFAGDWCSVGQVREYVLTSTPCYLFKGALNQLKKNGQIEVKHPDGTSRGFSNEHTRIHFLGGPPQPGLFEGQ